MKRFDLSAWQALALAAVCALSPPGMAYAYESFGVDTGITLVVSRDASDSGLDDLSGGDAGDGGADEAGEEGLAPLDPDESERPRGSDGGQAAGLTGPIRDAAADVDYSVVSDIEGGKGATTRASTTNGKGQSGSEFDATGDALRGNRPVLVALGLLACISGLYGAINLVAWRVRGDDDYE